MQLRRMIFAFSVALLGLPSAVVGCGGASSSDGLQVEINFDSGSPRSAREDALRVEVFVVSSCDAVSLGERPASALASTHVLRDGGGPPLGDELQAGDYGVLALAFNADCAVIATGCEPVSIGTNGSGSATVTLSAFSGVGCSLDEQCVIDTGRCLSIDDTCPGAEDETPCAIADTDGVCRMGECCTGCWDGVECQPGNRTQACGTGGDICERVSGCAF